MTNEMLRKQTIRQAKEEGNYASLSKFLRYENEYRRRSSLVSLYAILKKSKGIEATHSYIYYNSKWVCTADVFKKLGLKFNKDRKFIKEEL